MKVSHHRPWALVVSLLLLLGQAALSLASTPCSCREAASAAHSCCCRHAEDAPCPCSSHGAGLQGSGSCAHDAATVAARSMGEAPPKAAAPPPAVTCALHAAAVIVTPAQHRVVSPEPAGGFPPSQRLASLRATILRN